MTSRERVARGRDELLLRARDLAADGIPSFPCADDKRPTCPGGFKAATKTPEALRQLWNEYPGALIGVPTGAVASFDVLDIDPRHGGDDWLSAQEKMIPATRIHQTRSGGMHFLFKSHSGLRNSAGKIAAGVDVRAEGGYIIWWPAAGFPILGQSVPAQWPDWLVGTLLPQPQSPTSSSPAILRPSGNSYAIAALRKAATNVASAPRGCRNEMLNREMFSLARFIKSGDLDASMIAQTMAEAALMAGLKQREIVATVASALRARGFS